MSDTYMENCPGCGEDLSRNKGTRCTTCGHDIGFPNVRVASTPDEQAALRQRVQAAVADAVARGAGSEVDAFEQAVRDDSHAVVSTDWEFFRQFVLNNAPYSTYEKQVGAEIRLAADPDDDRDRRLVGEWLFSGYKEEVRYAALSLDGRGLTSYGKGEVVWRLRDDAIRIRASVLEENAYHFAVYHTHKLRSPVPPGYRAPWPERHRVAVAKLAERIEAGTTTVDFARLLLFTEGQRETDAFVEVHIYGPFTRKSLHSVKIDVRPRSPQERADMAAVKAILQREGVTWDGP